MFRLTEWKQTQFYKDVKLEGLLEVISQLIDFLLTI